MKKTVVLGVMAAVMLSMLASLAAYATETRGPMCCAMMGARRPSGMMHRKLAADLKLTDAQKQQLQAIRQDFRADTRSDRESLKTLKGEMLTLMSSQMPDKVRAEKLIGEMNDLHARIMTAGIDKIIDAKRILTAGQNKIIGAKIERARFMMERWPSSGK